FGALGRTRLMILGGVGAVSIAIVLAAALFVNKPAQETLYVGLDSPDLNQISMALAEANINFQVGTDGSASIRRALPVIPAGTL
ncbi:flagellar M-ring protein FliF, partial [Rhizobium leguminosarum]